MPAKENNITKNEIASKGCFFEIPEVLKFCFFVFDRDKKGFITQEEMRLFVDAMHGMERRPVVSSLMETPSTRLVFMRVDGGWFLFRFRGRSEMMLRAGNEMSTNVEFALDNLKYRKDGKFDFEEFKGMHHLYPSVLFPAFRLQNAMMQAMGGEQFWESKKLELSMQKEDERKREANREAREKAEAYKYREDQVRRHMGSIKYYLMPKNRAKYYEVYPLPKKYRLMEEQERANAKREKQLAEMRKKKAAQ